MEYATAVSIATIDCIIPLVFEFAEYPLQIQILMEYECTNGYECKLIAII